MVDAINNLDKPWNIIAWIGCGIFLLIILILLLKLNKVIFKRIQKKHDGFNLLVFQHVNSIVIVIAFIVLTISSFSGFQSVWNTMLGGTAIISAVIAFAAQDVLKDIIAGIMLSIHKPFRIGDRIALENGVSGIVEEMTIRHVVLLTIDTTRQIIPNSKINASRVVNLSYNRQELSIEFEFAVSYDSDMDLAKKVIEDAIKKSKYSIPGIYDEKGKAAYAEAHFLRFDASALIIHAIVYFNNDTPQGKVIDDINVKVREALVSHNIEIPYNYVNVITDPNKKENKKPKKKLKAVKK
ncbi:MAG: mechanosensitive ion channel [Clostridia bacterium]|nr:mechanosensitive ion channel [Clostridia bacterium]